MLAEELEQASWNVNELGKIIPNFMWQEVSLPYSQESGRQTYLPLTRIGWIQEMKLLVMLSPFFVSSQIRTAHSRPCAIF